MLKQLVVKCYQRAVNVKFTTHLLVSLIMRLVLVYYGEWQDTTSEVLYTDVDYKVVTDGSRQILEGNSPFKRHTYRYSPILAIIHTLNILVHPAFAKIIYSIFDILVAMLIYALVRKELKLQCIKAIQALANNWQKNLTLKSTSNTDCCDERNQPERLAVASACFWLYNPITGVISTRGNGDSFSSFFVILTLYFLMRSEDVVKCGHCYMYILAGGLSHGFAIHLRLYPILFSLSYFLVISDRNANNITNILKQFFKPSLKQLTLISGTLISFLTITGLFYVLYGWQYIEEAYLYHFVRKDVRHNFSLYFLMQYLSAGKEVTSAIEKLFVLTPQLVLIKYLSLSFGQFRQTLPFAMFTIAFVLVTFNSVVTSQYFVWYIALLPLCVNNLQSIKIKQATTYFMMWLLGQGLWLLPAYLLEFQTWNTFYWLGVQGSIFFIINNIVLVCIIQHYSFASFKINIKKIF